MGFKQPPLIFLVAGPSGRSPVTRLLDTHERVAITPDSAWVSSLASQRRVFDAPGGAKDFVEAFLDHPSATGWGFTRDALLSACQGLEDYPGFVRATYNAYAGRIGAGVLVDASPHLAANLHLIALLTKRARIMVIKEPGLSVGTPVLSGYATWFDGATAVTDAVATMERERFVQMRLEDLLKDPVGSIRTMVAYLGVGIAADGFSRIEGLAVATKPGTALRLGPGARASLPVRWAAALAQRYPKLGRKLRAWAARNPALVNRTLKTFRKVSR